MKKQIFIANPLYDSVFKFMMEDELIARMLLSALLKKDIVSVDMRPNEYSNVNNEDGRISIFRIDFGARVREEDGSEHLILIEVQKTWRSTEITRFRQYLGVQYENKRNVDANNNPLPIVSIYILGHKVGDIKEPVVYVSRRYLDYDCREITEGVPDPFVESLTHDSIIVQVPYLKGKARNRIEKIMSIFDQSYIKDGDPQIVSIEGRDITEDDEMKRMINRLATAAVIPDIRMTMNIEDEIFTELENLDTQVLAQKQTIVEQGVQLAQQGEQLAQQGEQLAQQKDMLRYTIGMLVKTGKSQSEIAEDLHMDVDIIKQLME